MCCPAIQTPIHSSARSHANACRDVDPDAVEDMTGKALPGAATAAAAKAAAPAPAVEAVAPVSRPAQTDLTLPSSMLFYYIGRGVETYHTGPLVGTQPPPQAASPAAPTDAEGAGVVDEVLEAVLDAVEATSGGNDAGSDTGANDDDDAALVIEKAELVAMGDDVFRVEAGEALAQTVSRMTSVFAPADGEATDELDASAQNLLAKMALYQNSIQSMSLGGEADGGDDFDVASVSTDVEALIAKTETFLSSAASASITTETRTELEELITRLRKQTEGFVRVQAPAAERSVTVTDMKSAGTDGHGVYALHLVRGNKESDVLHSYRDILNLRQVRFQ